MYLNDNKNAFDVNNLDINNNIFVYYLDNAFYIDLSRRNERRLLPRV